MTTFDKREEGFEKKFAMDSDQKFKAEARRNRLLGLWAAEKLGIAGDADVLRKVLADLTAKGIAITEPELRVKMDELMATAILQVKAGT